MLLPTSTPMKLIQYGDEELLPTEILYTYDPVSLLQKIVLQTNKSWTQLLFLVYYLKNMLGQCRHNDCNSNQLITHLTYALLHDMEAIHKSTWMTENLSLHRTWTWD